MSAEASDGLHVSPARDAVASALRRLGHALVGHRVDDRVLTDLATTIDAVLPVIESGEPRSRPVDDMKRRLFETAPADGESMDHFPDCVVSGSANPMGIAISV